MVACGRAHAPCRIAVDGQSLDIDHPAPDALVGLSCTSHTQRKRVALKLVGIEAPYAIAVGDGSQVDEVDECVDLVEFLALQHTTDELFGGRTVARGILPTFLIYRTRGGDARQRFQALGGEFGAEALAQGIDFLP